MLAEVFCNIDRGILCGIICRVSASLLVHLNHARRGSPAIEFWDAAAYLLYWLLSASMHFRASRNRGRRIRVGSGA